VAAHEVFQSAATLVLVFNLHLFLTKWAIFESLTQIINSVVALQFESISFYNHLTKRSRQIEEKYNLIHRLLRKLLWISLVRQPHTNCKRKLFTCGQNDGREESKNKRSSTTKHIAVGWKIWGYVRGINIPIIIKLMKLDGGKIVEWMGGARNAWRNTEKIHRHQTVGPCLAVWTTDQI